MLALAHIIAEGTRDEVALARDFLRGQSFGSEEAINSVGSLEHLKLAGRVGPLVVFAGGEEHRSRGAKGHQTILVEWQPLRRIVKLLELRVEPVWKMVVNGLYGLTDLAPARRDRKSTR